MQCEMCGAETQPWKTIVEGVELEVCANCAKHGDVIERPKTRKEIEQQKRRNQWRAERQREIEKEKQTEEMVVSDYAQIIRKAREKKNLTQKQMASQLNLKESFLQNIESGSIQPSIDLAKQLQRSLNIRLIEIYEPKNVATVKANSSGGLTIGDMIKVRKKKN